MIERVDHIGIAVDDLAAAKRLYGEVLGLRLLFEEDVPTERVRVAAYDGGGVRIELLAPTSSEGPVARFVASRGPGVHHVCYETRDVRAALERLAAAGVRTIDAEPRPGAGGCRVAFVHPKGAGGVLVELSEHPRGGPGEGRGP